MLRERPRIGITMRIDLESNRFYLARDYSEAVEAAGGLPVHISLIPSREYIAEVMQDFDGVLLPGSDSDVSPELYGKEPHANLGSVHPLKDQTDTLVLDEIARHKTPLLAICFGMQIFNVVRGGTLIQDIPATMPEAINHQQGKPRDYRSHRVRLLDGSIISELAGSSSAMVNSHHHQAIEKVGNGLVATAWTSDGLIEALEDTSKEQYLLAVQWHPEIGWQDDEFSRSIFSSLVRAAREFAESRHESQIESTGVSSN